MTTRTLVAWDPSTVSLESELVSDLAELPPLVGTGDVDYVCPHCGRTLLQRVVDGTRYDHRMFRCDRCRGYSFMGGS